MMSLREGALLILIAEGAVEWDIVHFYRTYYDLVLPENIRLKKRDHSIILNTKVI